MLKAAPSKSYPSVSVSPGAAWRRRGWKHLKAYLFLAPILISVGLFKYTPFVHAFVQSFYEWNGANVDRFIGLDNYTALFRDRTFYASLKNIALFTGSFVLIQLTLPLLAAVGVFRLRQAGLQSFFKSMFVLPMVVPYIIVFLLWKWIYVGDGLLDRLLEALGLESWIHAWLGESGTALWSIVFINFPWVSGIYFLIYLAGLLAVPQELFEVGGMDGMNGLQRLRHIELPLIRSQLRLVLVLAFIQQFQSFENVLVLTNGGPGFSTLTPALYLYKKGFEYNELGYASAIGVVVFVVLLLCTLAANRFIKPADRAE
ncbi:L-arabinose transport system permease protein AraP [Paenibacillus konkukensis]|uniref:L-arabinose transport system permease protein AraP n=1 Tax=Paenibacillus konkukensis TaxID=2020716 RepID=A0ABY4RWL6_9BACL|nr:sugar ABC transporter permease [Paenibacillus konkukensis]UQZ86081.1 L-arabinose transport system permease protein AraP [Paenibacillus konkukensis]